MTLYSRRAFLRQLAIAGGLSVIAGRIGAATTLSFGQIPAPDGIQRIISAGPPADALLLAVAPEKLIGLSSFDLAAKGCGGLSAAHCHLPRLGRLTGRAASLSVEKMLTLRPDLIVDCGTTEGTWRFQAQRVAKQSGIPLLLIDGRLQETASQLRQLGALLGLTQRTEQQALLADAFLTDAALFARSAVAKPRFYAARSATGLETGLQGSLHTEAVEFLGLENVAQLPGRSGLAQVSMEQLLVWQPDLILTQSRVTWQHIQREPLWQRLKAVQRRQVLLLDGLPFGWLDAPPSVNRLPGLRRLHARFDPAIAASFEADIRRYFRLFLHAELREAHYTALMEER